MFLLLSINSDQASASFLFGSQQNHLLKNVLNGLTYFQAESGLLGLVMSVAGSIAGVGVGW